MGTRIKVPAEAVRTREQILEGELVIGGYVWTVCHNCGGSGRYPSSMTPPGLCRFYCWAKSGGSDADAVNQAMGILPHSKEASDPTYGRRPIPVEKYVKRGQAADRREYRARVQWELDRPQREAEAARREAERVERERIEAERKATELAEKAKRQHLGSVGERIHVNVTVEGVIRMDGAGYYGRNRYLVRFRDSDKNQLVLWTDCPPLGCVEGAAVEITATVKKHDRFRDEAQTVVQRVKAKPVEVSRGV